MPRIQQLPALLINQIAAGEVVERPASVVKELLENAVDAGAARIDVEVARGGIDLIRVVDDGCGIDADDLPLAFASHATSKLTSVGGPVPRRHPRLPRRGAGLRRQRRPGHSPVPASRDQPHGAEVACHGGELRTVLPWNGAPGTRIEVRHLFYNTPARRKFLRAPPRRWATSARPSSAWPWPTSAYTGRCGTTARPFTRCPASMGLLDRIGLFFGAEVSGSLYRVEARKERFAWTATWRTPSCDRGGTQLQYLFLNGRWVRDRGLFQAVQEAYRGLLLTGRHPVAFLFLEVPPEEVDVNAHPAKVEVRFRDRDALYRLVLGAVRERLRQADLTARVRLNGGKSEASAQGDPSSSARPRTPTRSVSSEASYRSPAPRHAVRTPGRRCPGGTPRDNRTPVRRTSPIGQHDGPHPLAAGAHSVELEP